MSQETASSEWQELDNQLSNASTNEQFVLMGQLPASVGFEETGARFQDDELASLVDDLVDTHRLIRERIQELAGREPLDASDVRMNLELGSEQEIIGSIDFADQASIGHLEAPVPPSLDFSATPGFNMSQPVEPSGISFETPNIAIPIHLL